MFGETSSQQPLEPADAAGSPAVPPAPRRPVVGLDDPSVVLEHLLHAAPCGETVVLFEALEAEPLSRAEQLGALAALERQTAWLEATKLRMLARLQHTTPADDQEFLPEEVASVLHVATITAANRLHLAGELVGPRQATGEALAAGTITLVAARTLAEELADAEETVARQVEAELLPRAATRTPAELTRTLRRAKLTADPEGAAVAHERAVRDRRVVLTPEADGMASLSALLRAPDALLLYRGLTREAHAQRRADRAAGSSDEPGIDARRADLLVEHLSAGLLGGDRGVGGDTTSAGYGGDPEPATTRRRAHRCAPAIEVTIDAATLLGLAEHPGELSGYGPIPAALARALAADGTWRRLVTDPMSGQLLDYGRRTYRPPEAVRRHIRGRDRRCRFPGCGRRARDDDLDHVIPWEKGGVTAPQNMVALCRHDHRAKTVGGWSVELGADASCIWTSPAGLRYRTLPARYPPDG